MDQFMVDVTHIPQAEDGDEVTLLGAQGDERITADELGRLSGRFPTSLSAASAAGAKSVSIKNKSAAPRYTDRIWKY